jgi:hypothetical protein
MAATTRQDNWRFCNKCCVLWWNGRSDNGRCPAGGAHDGRGSWNFYLPADPRGLGQPVPIDQGTELHPIDE